jgi:hypothetical protein
MAQARSAPLCAGPDRDLRLPVDSKVVVYVEIELSPQALPRIYLLHDSSYRAVERWLFAVSALVSRVSQPE